MPLFTVALTAAAVSGARAQSEAPDINYRVIAHIQGPDSRWDLLSVDASRHRLYMARVGGVTAVDLLTNQVTPTLVHAKLTHGVVPVGETSVVVTSNAENDSLLWFEGTSGEVLGETKVGKEPDTVVYDAATNAIISVNANDLTIVSATSRKALASIALQGDPEFAVVDGKGFLYDNLRKRHEIAVIDLRKHEIVKHYPLANCQEPTGLAYDAPSALLISACGSGVAKILRASDGRDIATIAVGPGADAVVLDALRRLVFIPSGHSGTLSVISLSDPAAPRLAQTLATKVGTRTGALDPTTGWLYLPSADFEPIKHGEWPNVVAHTMHFLVIGVP